MGMHVFKSIDEAQGLEGSAVCLGNFDGVHLGHQALFQEARKYGPAVVLTFEPHPGKILQPELAPKLISPLSRKLELLSEQGLEAVIVQPFTQEYAQTSPQAFEQVLFSKLRVAHVVVGYDFTYGSKRGGTLHTLRDAAHKSGARLHVVAPVTVEGVVASSSRIREYVLEGRIEAARRLLGRFFDLDGSVVPGDARGRTIGFPTANVETTNEVRPAPGVYAVKVRIEGEGAWRMGAANIGVKPTFGGKDVTIEVHLLNFHQDIYCRKLRVQFIDRLRSEMRFSSLNELKDQIARDVEKTRAILSDHVAQGVQRIP